MPKNPDIKKVLVLGSTIKNDKTGLEPGSKLIIKNDITYYANAIKNLPKCSLKVVSATEETVTISATCQSTNEISKYEFKINDGNYVDNNTNNEYTFDSFDLSTIVLKVTNNFGNSTQVTFSDEALKEGYEIIYNVFDKRYDELLNSKEKYEREFLDKTYPVGSIYITNSNINPSETLGGTWEAYAKGRTLLGVGNNGIDNYDGSDLTGGTETVTLATINLPNHTHNATPLGTIQSTFSSKEAETSSNGAHTHSYNVMSTVEANEDTTTSYDEEAGAGYNYGSFINRLLVTSSGSRTTTNGSHSHTYIAEGTVDSKFTGEKTTTSSTGNNTTFNIMNPYITTYMWKRVG